MEHNIPELVAQLTLEEKAGLCSGADFWHTKTVERLGIPTLMVSDGPHGLRTQDPERDDPNHSRKAVCFPAGCSVAASFDPDLARREGAAIGREARAFGVGVVLGPAINIKRSPLCGRNFEMKDTQQGSEKMLTAREAKILELLAVNKNEDRKSVV